jgi:hypothetical protein
MVFVQVDAGKVQVLAQASSGFVGKRLLLALNLMILCFLSVLLWG